MLHSSNAFLIASISAFCSAGVPTCPWADRGWMVIYTASSYSVSWFDYGSNGYTDDLSWRSANMKTFSSFVVSKFGSLDWPKAMKLLYSIFISPFPASLKPTCCVVMERLPLKSIGGFVPIMILRRHESWEYFDELLLDTINKFKSPTYSVSTPKLFLKIIWFKWHRARKWNRI